MYLLTYPETRNRRRQDSTTNLSPKRKGLVQYDDTQTTYRYLLEILSGKIEDKNWSTD
jgi:hypothetical protein